MFKFVALLVTAAGFSAWPLLMAVPAADLVTAYSMDATTDPAQSDERQASLRDALSEYLTLLMVRATFDVVDRSDLEAQLTSELHLWGGRAPSVGAKTDLDRQLLAEGSYYLVSLSYTVKVGGAAFPGDKAELVYTSDTIVELDDLQRKLAETIAAGGDTLPILVRAEEIRALTEGNTEVPADVSVFKNHAAILDQVIEAAARGTRT